MKTDTRYFVFPGLPEFWERLHADYRSTTVNHIARTYPEYWMGSGDNPDEALRCADDELRELLAWYAGPDDLSMSNPLYWCRKGCGRYKAAKKAAADAGLGPCFKLTIDHHPWNPRHGELPARLQGKPVIYPGIPAYWHLLLGYNDDTHDLIAKCYPEYWAAYWPPEDVDVDSVWQRADEHFRQYSSDFSSESFFRGVFHPTRNVKLPPRNPLYWFAQGYDRYSAAKLAAFKGGLGPLKDLVIDHGVYDSVIDVTHDRFPPPPWRNMVLDVPDDAQARNVEDPDADEPDDPCDISQQNKREQVHDSKLSRLRVAHLPGASNSIRNTRCFSPDDFPRFEVDS